MTATKTSSLKRTVPYGRVYWPNCKVCQYLKLHPDVRQRVMQSTYFNPYGTESMAAVWRSIGDPIAMSNIKQHMIRHQQKDLIRAEKALEESKIPTRPILDAIEFPTNSTTAHERSLDNFIREGDVKLEAGEMAINATSYLQAIKIKADIEKNTKDRRLDAVKSFFGRKADGGTGPTEGSG